MKHLVLSIIEAQGIPCRMLTAFATQEILVIRTVKAA